jgi:hypothetical protein
MAYPLPWLSREAAMKLIIVERSRTTTYQRLLEKFDGERNVKVILERRLSRAGGRKNDDERRRLKKAFDGRDYLVIHVVDEKKKLI